MDDRNERSRCQTTVHTIPDMAAGDTIARLGGRLTEQIEAFARFTLFSLDALRWAGRPASWRWRLLAPQLFLIGTRSIPVVAIVGAFIGMIMAVEMYNQFALLGMENRLGGIIDISVVRQIGPVLASVMIAGRVGGAVSAELGTMRVTEQIDALAAMGANPIGHLVVPRVAACLIMVPILTLFSDLMGIIGAQLVTVNGFGVDAIEYRRFSREFVETYDLMSGVIKSVFFGLAIGLISCYKGFYCRPGAAGVGQAATDAFVTSFLAIIAMNLFLAKFLGDLYLMIWGPSPVTL